MKRSTNTEFVKELMERSKHGALAQAFVLQALEHYAYEVLKDESEWSPNSMVSQQAWRGLAQETLGKITARSLA